MADFENLLYETSPDGTRTAIVEQDDRVTYCYLHRETTTNTGPQEAGAGNLQACWLRNLVKGPVSFSAREMERGVPPVLPRLHCDHPDGLAPLGSDQLEVVWLESGNGAAFLVDGEIEAIIPPWSGLEGFHGYARRCKSANQVCWPFPQDQKLVDEFKRSQSYWQMWRKGDPWGQLQSQLMSVYEGALGKHQAYYAIDGNHWPPKAVVQLHADRNTFWLTAGVSIRRQPCPHPELPVPEGLERIEIGLRLEGDLSGTYYQSVLRLMSSISNYPWYAQQWIGPAHSYPFAESQEFPTDADATIARFPRLVFTCDPSFGIDLPAVTFTDLPIHWLWMVPITTAEMRYMNANGVQALLERLRNHGVTGWKPDRESVV